MRIEEFSMKNYPQEYQKYLIGERDLVKKAIDKGDGVIDIGCEDGRAIPFIAKLAKSLVGIDINPAYVNEVKKVAKQYGNVRIIKMNAENLGRYFGSDRFDVSILLWNTIACVKNPLKVLSQVRTVTKRLCVFTVPAKGGLKQRIGYYNALGIKYGLDKRTEAVYSNLWGVTRAYSKSEIANLCKRAGFGLATIRKLDGFEYYIIARR